jgi:small GTP-binding protein
LKIPIEPLPFVTILLGQQKWPGRSVEREKKKKKKKVKKNSNISKNRYLILTTNGAIGAIFLHFFQNGQRFGRRRRSNSSHAFFTEASETMSIPKEDKQHPFKVTFLGGPGVGKTTLCMAIQSKGDSVPGTGDYVPTVMEYTVIDVPSPNGVDSVSITLTDTAGSHDYDRLRPLCFPGTRAFIICVPANSRYHMANLNFIWLPEARHFVPLSCVFLCLTKIDKRTDPAAIAKLKARYNQEMITRAEGEAVVAEFGLCGYYEVSAHTEYAAIEAMMIEVVWRAQHQQRRAAGVMDRLLSRPVRPAHTHEPEPPRKVVVKPLPNDLARDWAALGDSLSDVALVAEGETIDSHRIFLCMASSLWRGLFLQTPKFHRTHGTLPDVVKSFKRTKRRKLHWTVVLASDVTAQMVRTMQHLIMHGESADASADAAVVERFRLKLRVSRRWIRLNDELCDVALEVGDESIGAHRVLLSARSTFFAHLFSGRFKDGRPRDDNDDNKDDDDERVHTRLQDVDAALVRLMVEHSRGNRLPEDIDVDTCLALIAVANQFGAPVLLAECETAVAAVIEATDGTEPDDRRLKEIQEHCELHRATQLVALIEQRLNS